LARDDEPKGKAGEAKSVASMLRDQLLTLGLLVFLVGLVETESYYAAFGVRYQFLSLPTSHLIYRGLTTVLAAWYLGVLYVAGIAWICFEEIRKDRTPLGWRMIIAYALTIILVSASFAAAGPVGQHQARADMTIEDSRLPRVDCIVFEDAQASANSGPLNNSCQYHDYRHLLTQGDEMILLMPVHRSDVNTFPNIVHLKQGGIREFRTRHY
jgi:hypothetical protein